jgi:hypothetical protein
MKIIITTFILILCFSCKTKLQKFNEKIEVVNKNSFDSLIKNTIYESLYDSAKFYLYLYSLGNNMKVNNKYIYAEELPLYFGHVEDKGLQTHDYEPKNEYEIYYSFCFCYEDSNKILNCFQKHNRIFSAISFDTIRKRYSCIWGCGICTPRYQPSVEPCEGYLGQYEELGLEYLKLKKNRLHPWLYNECVKRKIFEDESFLHFFNKY